MNAPLRVRRSAVEAFVDAAVHGEVQALPWLPTALIDLLDDADGDADLEPCPAGDDGLHYYQSGYREGWGYPDDPGIVPIYGVDQSAGPLNCIGRPHSGYSATSWGA